MTVPLSILDLAAIGPGESARDSLDASVRLAQVAERGGYTRIWYAEHHNMPTIASSANAVVIAHVAAHTERIRLGAGGVMLPNHAPLVIAEQFGTLATLHPGRIDLGLGRAPGTDGATMRALRRDPSAADTFPQDVQELQGYLRGESLIPGVSAIPGAGTDVPLYILGSSMFGAHLAAALGLPYSFASHFAPAALVDAVATYRREFRPSAQLAEPYVIAGVNAVVAPSADQALDELQAAKRLRVRALLRTPQPLTDDEVDLVLDSPQGAQIASMLACTAVGTPDQAVEHLDAFATHADADELIVAFLSPAAAGRLRSVELLAGAARLRA